MLSTTFPQLVAGHPLIGRLMTIAADLELDPRDFVIFGSGPLLAHGLRDRIDDLDVVARGRTWERAYRHGLRTKGPLNGAPMAAFCGGSIQFSAGWISADWNADDLIDRADVIAGLRFAQVQEVLRYKMRLNRPGDQEDIEKIKRHPELWRSLSRPACAGIN